MLLLTLTRSPQHAGSRVRFRCPDMDVQVATDVATRCGSVTRKGDLSHLLEGDLVSLKQARGGYNKWRVMAFKGHRISRATQDRQEAA